MSETPIRKAILDWLLAHRMVDIAYQNDRIAFKRRKLINKYRPAGFPDIGGNLIDGRALYIEVKVPGEEPRADQAAFLRSREKMGCIAFWADSVDMTELMFKLFEVDK